MITQTIYLKEYDWSIRVFYGVTHLDTLPIAWSLNEMGFSTDEVREIISDVRSLGINHGLTFSNLLHRCSIVVINITSSAAEFQNTFDHEKGHLATHIADAYHIDLRSEEYQYLVGDIGQKLFKVAHIFMCDTCRINLYDLAG